MLDIIYQDDDIIIVNKPSGLLCVPGLSSPDNLFDQVKKHHPNARTVHRLDMSTSGLVIFALHYEAQKATSQLFETRKISKRYLARTLGELKATTGEVYAPVMCDWPNRPKQKIDFSQGKPAKTFFRVLEKSKGSSLVELVPHTGRTHQLRIHMEFIGHPILGDDLYHQQGSNALAPRLLLHACELTFTHPFNNKTCNIISPIEF